MPQRLVIGLDSSTQSTKAIAWNHLGEAIAEGRADIPMQSPQIGYYEQNPVDWWISCCKALTACVQQVDSGCLQAIAISNQRETLAFLDQSGEPTHPAIVWLDERAKEEVKSFSDIFGADNIHRITGRVADVIPCLYRFLWMKHHKPEIYKSTEYFVDVQSYLANKLCAGRYKTGWISADPMGIIDMLEKDWSHELLEQLELSPGHLPELYSPGSLLGKTTEESAISTGLPAGLPVYAAGGDGQLAGLGTNCTTEDRAYINLGTAVVSGVWSPTYRYHCAWRTMLAAQGGYIFENCLRSGMFLVDWFVEQFISPTAKADGELFARLDTEAQKIPIGCDGLLIQPYFCGSMDPHWDSDARGAMLGLHTGHTSAHIYRAIVEGIVLNQVISTRTMEEATGQQISHYVAIGGGAKSAFWCQALADVSAKPVHVSNTVEASALGAGMIAAYGAGWYDSITEAASAMSGKARVYHPDPVRHRVYARLLDIYKNYYQTTAELNHQMVAFASEQNQGAQVSVSH